MEKENQMAVREDDRERIPLGWGAVTSYCKVPYGTAPDWRRSLLHAERGAFTSLENIQEKNERQVQQGEKKKRRTPRDWIGILF